MLPCKSFFGWVSQDIALNLAEVRSVTHTEANSLPSHHHHHPLKKIQKQPYCLILNNWRRSGEGEPMLSFEHTFIFNCLQGSHCSGTGGYKMLTSLQQHPLCMFSFPLLKSVAQSIPGPIPLFARTIYNHKTCTCHFKPMFELRAKVKGSDPLAAFVWEPVGQPQHSTDSHSLIIYSITGKKHCRLNWQDAPHPTQKKASSQLFSVTAKFLSPLVRREPFQAGM